MEGTATVLPEALATEPARCKDLRRSEDLETAVDALSTLLETAYVP